MNKQIKRYFRFFWAWNESKKLVWLNQMSQDGWHLSKCNRLIYSFTKGDSKNLRYFVDFRVMKRENQAEYFEIFKESGWNYITNAGCNYYFSTSAENKHQEVYTDNKSRSEKYRLLTIVHILVLLPISYFLMFFLHRFLDTRPVLMGVLLVIAVSIDLFVVYSLIRLIAIISKFNKEIKE